MLNKQLKELWSIRFRKIFELERDSFYFYRTLIKSNSDLLEGSEAATVLRKIMQDEVQHMRAALELIQIVERKEILENAADQISSEVDSDSHIA